MGAKLPVTGAVVERKRARRILEVGPGALRGRWSALWARHPEIVVAVVRRRRARAVLRGDIQLVPSASPRSIVMAGPLRRGGVGARSRSCRRLLWGTGHRRRLCNGQGKPPKLSSAGNTNSPCQLRLIARALGADFKALRAVWPLPVALEILLGAGEAVIGGAASRSSPASLPNGILGLGLLRCYCGRHCVCVKDILVGMLARWC